jgi:hypothetical protein
MSRQRLHKQEVSPHLILINFKMCQNRPKVGFPVYKTTTTKILPTSTDRPSTSATTPAINKVNIEQRPQKPKESGQC